MLARMKASASLLLALAVAAFAASGFSLESPAFKDGGAIPPQYACDGHNESPPLRWSEPPRGTQSLALIMSDRLASHALFVNWTVYNIPASARELKPRYRWSGSLADGTLQGRNDRNGNGYFGPCPGPRGTHSFTIDLYALDETLPKKIGYSAGQVAQLMKGHVLAQARLSATYRRHF